VRRDREIADSAILHRCEREEDSMEITDCPHAAGTAEHGDWVRNVFIPTVESERAEVDRRVRGAPSIGGVLIRGSLPDALADDDELADLGRLFVDVA
jgi:hypothetical protein